jgi:hypothetical protein
LDDIIAALSTVLLHNFLLALSHDTALLCEYFIFFLVTVLRVRIILKKIIHNNNG